MDIATLGLAVDSRPVTTAAKALDTLAAAGQRAETVAQKVETAFNSEATSATRAKGALSGLTEATTTFNSAQQKTVATSEVASASLGKVEMSARATAAAMRGVPAQFTDIITSLQGGQAPLTVFMQQGGQLKDMFGGAGNAAKALSTYVLGLISPLTVAAAAVGVVGLAYHQGTQESRAFQNAVTLTGDAIGVSNSQFAAMGVNISNIVGTRGKAAEVLTEIASSGRFAGESVQGIAEAAILMEKATGKAVAKTIEEFIKLADAPAKASAELNKQYNYLTASVYEQIKALEEQGKKTQAAELAEKSYADAMKGRAQTVIDNAGLMEKAWRGVALVAKGAWDAMLNVGRDTSVGDQLSALEAQLRDRRARNAGLGIKEGKATQEIIEQIAGLKETLRLEQRSAEASAERARINAAGVAAVDAVSKANERAASKQEQLNKALRDYRASLDDIRASNPNSALLDPKKIAAAEAGIREQFKSAAGPVARPDTFLTESAKAYTKAMEDLDKVQLSAGASADKLSKTQEVLRGIQASPAWETFNNRKREEIILAASLSQAEEDRQESIKATTAARDADIKKTVAATASDNAKAQALEDEIELWGKSEEAIKSLTIARLRDQQAEQMSYGNEAMAKAIEDRIAAIERLAVATDKTNNLKIADKAAKDAAANWERATNKIESDITNALMRGFESGKSIAENLRDVIVNMFKSMVLEPTVRAIVQPVVGAAQSALGMGPSSGATGGGVGGMVSTASNLNTLYGTAAQLYGGYTAGASAASLVGANAVGAVGGDALGALIAGNGGWAGVSAGAGAGAGAAGAGASTGIMGGIGSALSAIPVWGWIAMAILTQLGGPQIDKLGSGVAGKLGAGGGVGAYDVYKEDHHGLFGIGAFTTENRDWRAADPGIQKFFESGVTGVTSAAKKYAAAIGLTTEAIDGFTQDIDVNLTGLDAAGIREKLTKTLATFGDDLVKSVYGDVLAPFAKDGETVSQTLARLGDSLSAVNATLSALGLTAIDVSLNGAATASALVDAFGGVEKMQASVGKYYELMYTDAEKAAKATENLDKQFAALGLTVPDNAAAFRALVESIDISTVEGQKLAASVIELAPAFSQASQAARAAANEMVSAISNWGSSDQLRAFKAQQLQQSLSSSGLDVSIDQIMGATRESVIAYFNSLDPNSAAAKALLKNQQQIYDFVVGSTPTPTEFAGSAGAGSWGEVVSDAQSASSAILNAWQSVTDGIFDEVDRIRGLMGIGRTGSLSEAQAALAIANAQANAGDQNAARSLPELSRNVISLATAGAASLQDLRRIQGQTALTLERTGTNLGGRYGTTIPANMVPFVQAGSVTTGGTTAISSAGPVSAPNWSPEWAQLLEYCKATQVNTRTVANLLTGAMPAQTRLQVQVITP